MDLASTGITRPLDNLGRVVIPKELRDNWKWDCGDRIEFLADPASRDEVLILRKYQTRCMICSKSSSLHSVNINDDGAPTLICADCIKRIKSIK